MSEPNATAVIDGAIVYGASRLLRGLYKDPPNAWERKYREADDKLLFQEFLHNLLLYDKILIDRPVELEELYELFEQVATYSGTRLLDTEQLAPDDNNQFRRAIAGATCDLVRAVAEAPQQKQALLSVPIPWAYTSGTHIDCKMVEELVGQYGCDRELLPFIIFSYRGLCYTGFAHNLAQTRQLPFAYLASPGRMAALKRLVSAQDLRRLNFARTAYRDLVSLLKLPSAGYDFSHLTSLPLQFSELALTVSTKPPQDALRFVMELRASAEGKLLRERWALRIWGKSSSPAIGTNYPFQQKMENIRADGNVFQMQIYYACPADV